MRRLATKDLKRCGGDRATFPALEQHFTPVVYADVDPTAIHIDEISAATMFPLSLKEHVVTT